MSFKRLISREFLKHALIPILLIEVALLVMYFAINQYISSKIQESTIDETIRSIERLSEKEAENIDEKLLSVANGVKMAQSQSATIFENLDQYPAPKNKPIFAFHKNGVYYKTNDNGGSSLYYSAITKIGEKEKQKAFYTESLDPIFKTFYETHKDIVAGIYINTYDSMNRYYPFLPKVYEIYDPYIDIPKFNFYYEADEKHNPLKKHIWTDVYLDPAGQGWMATCAAPVYRGDTLEGVIGADITVENFIKSTLNMKLPYGSSALLANKNGQIIAMHESIEKVLNIKELKSHKYDSAIKQNTFKPQEFNLLKNKDSKIAATFEKIFKSKEKSATIEKSNDRYFVTAANIKETGWKLIVFTSESKIIEEISGLKKLTNNIGLAALALMSVFYVIFFVVLYRRSISIAENITKPIDELVKMVKQISARSYKSSSHDKYGIDEIDALVANIDKMSTELNTLYASMKERIDKEVAENREKDMILLKQAKNVALSELISNIAHQWRQPLNIIAISIQNIKLLDDLGELSKEELDKLTSDAIASAAYLSKTIDNLRDVFLQDSKRDSFKVGEAILRSLEFIEKAMSHQQIKVSINKEIDFSVTGDINSFIQAILAILTNAKEAFERYKNKINKQITISTYAKDKKFILEIKDNAGGFKEEIRDKIFEPYFTTKFKSQGVGLGLYISKKAIEDMGGSIEIQNSENGASVIIAFEYD